MKKKNKAASQLVGLRWKKEKPNPEYFRKLGKLSAKKRWGKKSLSPRQEIDNDKKE
jgi:hypothetical protein